MKLKCLAVTSLLVLGCSLASAQGSATLGFTSAGDLQLYCNFEQIQWGGSNNFYFQGIDNIQAACFPPNSNEPTVLGTKSHIFPIDGAPVLEGPAYAYADNIYDAFSNAFTGLQWYVITQTKPSGPICILPCTKHYGWVGYVGLGGLEFLGNYGYLSKSTPADNQAKMPVKSISNAGAAKESHATLTRTIH